MLERRFERDGDPVIARERHLGMQATGRFVTPEEVAAGITHLASPQAASTVGATLVIDGGFSIW
jgi:NAD(P)-dependent dehydrogenase (short-subunit alcohol dehydrogenase family)